MLVVYTPRGGIRIPIFTCHSCFDQLEDGELTEHKIKLRDKIKAAAMAAIQDDKVEAVRNQQDVEGGHVLPLDRPPRG